MKSKVIVMTGATGAVGAAAARRLVSDGHHVVLVGRSAAKTSALAHELNAEYFIADFTRFRYVRELAHWLLARYPRIDVLAHNAGGVFGPERRVTPDGHEMTLQVNYIAGFVLTTLLIDRLKKSRATVICASGLASTSANIDLYDLESERRFSATKAYCNSKLAQILFTRELYRRYGRGRGIETAAFHRGNVASETFRHAPSPLRWLREGPIGRLSTADPDEGADTLVFLAEARPDVDFPSGQFFVRNKVAIPNEQADDRMLAFELWNRSETMVEKAAIGRRSVECQA